MSWMERNERLVVRAAGTITCAALLVIGVAGWRRVAATREVPAAPVLLPSALPQAMPNGEEVVLVFLGSAGCAGSQDPALPAVLAQARRAVQAQLGSNGTVVMRGVAVDGDAMEGLRFLAKFPAFDEVSVGRNWMNAAAIEFYWRDHPSRGVVPQLVALRRRVSSDSTTYTVGPDEVLFRKIGIDEIQQWADAGAPLTGTPDVAGDATRGEGTSR